MWWDATRSLDRAAPVSRAGVVVGEMGGGATECTAAPTQKCFLFKLNLIQIEAVRGGLGRFGGAG